MHCCIKRILQLCLIPFLGYAQCSQAIYDTPGVFSVGPDGSSSYNIPIVVPPGTGGMIPAISINFNSQNHNSILGKGWELEGITQIVRCPRTKADDGKSAGVKYTNEDKFCLDGQKLIAINGIYGEDLTEYRTKQNVFSKIISYGLAGAGPQRFKVWTKSGLILDYGNTVDSRIEGAGSSSVRAWQVNKITDTNGNYINFIYTENNTNGEVYINRIDYTGNDSPSSPLTPYASIRFEYENRIDEDTAYIGNLIVSTTKRLKNIKTYYQSNVVKNYILTYQNNGSYHTASNSTPNGSLLTSIQECDGASTPTCNNPTTFTWNPAALITTQFSTSPLLTGKPTVAVGDINSDSLADSVLYNSTNATCNIYTAAAYFNFAKSNGSGYPSGLGTDIGIVYGWGGSRPMIGGSIQQCVELWPAQFITDLNLDGYGDYITTAGGSISVRFSNAGNSFAASQNWGAGYVIGTGDFNGDGRADIFYDSSTPTSPGTIRVGIVSATGISSSIDTGIPGGTFGCQNPSGGGCGGYFYINPDIAVGDFNGDGLTDIYQYMSGNMYFSKENAIGPSVSWPLGYKVVSVGDVNGDGLADVLFDTTTPTAFGKLYVALSLGNGFATIYATNLDGGGGAAGGGYICAGYSGGTVSCPSSYKNIYKNPYAVLGDVNGDGLADLQYASTNIHLANDQSPDLMTTITNGLGEITSIVYSKLNNSSVYTNEPGAIYPIRSMPSATRMYVVSSYSSSNGVGGMQVVNYQYSGGKVDLYGRGFLGFRSIKQTVVGSGISQTTFYKQDYPFVGLPLQVEKRRIDNSNLLAATQNNYKHTITGTQTDNQVIYTYLEKSVDQTYDLNGSLLLNSTSEFSYDDYGNVLSIKLTSNDGVLKNTVNTYYNDPVKWFLGRLIRSQITTNTP